MRHSQIMTEFGPLPDAPFQLDELDDEELETLARLFEASLAQLPARIAEINARELWAIGVQAGKEACRKKLGLPDFEAEWLRANPWFEAGELPPGYEPPESG